MYLTALTNNLDNWTPNGSIRNSHCMTELVRSTCLSDFSEVAQLVGMCPDLLMSAAGIDRSTLMDANMRIPVQAVAHLLELASRDSRIEAFVLLLAERRQVSLLGPIALLLREEPTVQHAVWSLAKSSPCKTRLLALRLNESDGEALVAIDFLIARQRALSGRRVDHRSAFQSDAKPHRQALATGGVLHA